jgi:hypothetical protein
MTALLIIAVLAVAGFAAFKISKSKEKVSINESVIVEPVKSQQPKVEVVIEPKKEVEALVKKELTLKPKKQTAEKKAEPKQKKVTTKKSDKKQK